MLMVRPSFIAKAISRTCTRARASRSDGQRWLPMLSQRARNFARATGGMACAEDVEKFYSAGKFKDVNA